MSTSKAWLLRLQLLIDAAAQHIPINLARHVINNAFTSLLVEQRFGEEITEGRIRIGLLSSFEAPGSHAHYPAITTTERKAAIDAVVIEWKKQEEIKL